MHLRIKVHAKYGEQEKVNQESSLDYRVSVNRCEDLRPGVPDPRPPGKSLAMGRHENSAGR